MNESVMARYGASGNDVARPGQALMQHEAVQSILSLLQAGAQAQRYGLYQ